MNLLGNNDRENETKPSSRNNRGKSKAVHDIKQTSNKSVTLTQSRCRSDEISKDDNETKKNFNGAKMKARNKGKSGATSLTKQYAKITKPLSEKQPKENSKSLSSSIRLDLNNQDFYARPHIRRKVSLRGLPASFLKKEQLIECLLPILEEFSKRVAKPIMRSIYLWQFIPGKVLGDDFEDIKSASAIFVLANEKAAKLFCRMIDGRSFCDSIKQEEKLATGYESNPVSEYGNMNNVEKDISSIFHKSLSLQESMWKNKSICSCDLSVNSAVPKSRLISTLGNIHQMKQNDKLKTSGAILDDLEFQGFVSSLEHGRHDSKLENRLLNDETLAFEGEDFFLQDTHIQSKVLKNNGRRQKKAKTNLSVHYEVTPYVEDAVADGNVGRKGKKDKITSKKVRKEEFSAIVNAVGRNVNSSIGGNEKAVKPASKPGNIRSRKI